MHILFVQSKTTIHYFDKHVNINDISSMQNTIEQLSRKIKILSLVCFLFFIISGVLGYQLIQQQNIALPLPQNSLLPASIKGNAENEIKNLINTQYIEDSTKTNFREGELKGYVGALEDPYSEYLSENDWKKFEEALNENYVGVGIRFNNTIEGYVVEEVIKSSPAEGAGVLKGDMLYKIDGVPTSEIEFEKLADAIKGEIGTQVVITVLRNSEEKNFTITRKPIQIEQVKLSTENNIAHISISSFGENISQKMPAIINEINNKKIDNVIVDVRSNGGGLLDEAVEIASYFMDEGETVIIEKSKKGNKEYKSIAETPNLKGKNIILLQDKYSASASEILAGALRDNNNSLIVGEKSFGKGVMQSVFPLSNNGVLKLTTSEWLTPSGIGINKKGITPDVVVKPDEDMLEVAKQQFTN
jgi:carboxyl-terminal processing protease